MHPISKLAGAGLLTLCSCHAPEKADAFVAPDAGWSKQNGWTTAALYLPNRLIDLLDIVHIGIGVGPGFGLGVHFTRYGRLIAVTGVDAGIGWLGRFVRPTQAAIYAFAAAGPTEALASPNPDGLWHIPKWDLGLIAHDLLVFAYLGVAPDELVDFLVGWSTYDLKRDDW